MNILILGCGWIGEAIVAKRCAEGHRVYATTTKEEKYQRLKDAGIFAILCDFDQPVNPSDFPQEVDYVLNSVPAIRRLSAEQIQQRFARVVEVLGNTSYRKHIFLSSVGIYPDIDGVFDDESTILTDSNLALAEEYMRVLPHTIIYRLGGLFGENRVLAKYFENKICAIGQQLANFIHLRDVLEILDQGFKKLPVGEFYNIVTPEHPLKKEVVLSSAQKYGFALPVSFDKQADFQKTVSGRKVENALQYTFLYPSPLDF